ncbi:hypothetical protein [Spirosoma telluris]|uniref:hypothetical protein n=1 Tax=Spirosoma telluris TaxID=2183553 RepID=UPI002FC3A110
MDRGEQNVIDLVNAWAVYSEATSNPDLAGFCLHYLTEHTHPPTVNQHRPVAAVDGLYDEKWVESLTGNANRSLTEIRPVARLAALVGRLSKYGYFYSKKAMQPLNFKGIDDPVYLIVLVQMGTPRRAN